MLKLIDGQWIELPSAWITAEQVIAMLKEQGTLHPGRDYYLAGIRESSKGRTRYAIPNDRMVCSYRALTVKELPF